MKKNKNDVPYFFQRLLAFIIDIIIVGMVSSLLSTPFLKNDSIEKLSSDVNATMQQYVDGKIDMKTYFSQYIDISYEMSRINGISTIIEIIVLILYFIILQYYNNGQTFGKKIMKIRVIRCDNNDLDINDLVVRSLVANSILINMIILAFTIFAGKNLYFYALLIFECVNYLLIILSLFMILFSKQSRGIHDLLAHTRVVRDI